MQLENKVDNDQIAYFPSIIANRWLAVRLELLGNLVTLGAAIFVIITVNSVTDSEAWLVISQSLNITQALNFLVRDTADVETVIVGDDTDLLVLLIYHDPLDKNNLLFVPEPKKN